MRWNEPVPIIRKLNGFDIADEDIDLMSYNERCGTLNKKPVLVARYFQYRVGVFFKDIVLDGPPRKTLQYYSIRVESFIWILNSPQLTKFNISEYPRWVDSVIPSDLPYQKNEQALFEFVKTYLSLIATHRPVVNIEMKSVGSILVNLLQTIPLLHSP